MFREFVALKEVVLQHRATDELAADMLTKALPPAKFSKFRDEVMGGEKFQRFFDKESKSERDRLYA